MCFHFLSPISKKNEVMKYFHHVLWKDVGARRGTFGICTWDDNLFAHHRTHLHMHMLFCFTLMYQDYGCDCQNIWLQRKQRLSLPQWPQLFGDWCEYGAHIQAHVWSEPEGKGQGLYIYQPPSAKIGHHCIQSLWIPLCMSIQQVHMQYLLHLVLSQ